MASPHHPISRKRRPLVGIVVESFTAYGRDIIRGITRYANLQRRWVLFTDFDRFLNEKMEWPAFDGAIVAGVPGKVFDHAREKCSHLVYCSGGGDPRVSPVVALDAFAAGKMAGEHLLDLGLTQFGFYGYFAGHPASEQRLAGLRLRVEAKGYTCITSSLPTPTPQERVSHAHRPAMIQWLKSLPKPVGILTFDDTYAHDLAGACLEADILVPDQVAIIGVNNDDLLCESAWPPLSSVDVEFSRVGFKAAEILDRLLAGEEVVGEERLMLLPPLGIVQRQSTNVQAIKDPHLLRAIRFIAEHACDPCSVDDILREVPVNRRWLERSFASQFGRTVHDEIARARIETAKRLLRESEFSLDDVAFRCGFAESKRFYVVFRQIAGTTPAAFRRSAISKKT